MAARTGGRCHWCSCDHRVAAAGGAGTIRAVRCMGTHDRLDRSVVDTRRLANVGGVMVLGRGCDRRDDRCDRDLCREGTDRAQGVIADRAPGRSHRSPGPVGTGRVGHSVVELLTEPRRPLHDRRVRVRTGRGGGPSTSAGVGDARPRAERRRRRVSMLTHRYCRCRTRRRPESWLSDDRRNPARPSSNSCWW